MNTYKTIEDESNYTLTTNQQIVKPFSKYSNEVNSQTMQFSIYLPTTLQKLAQDIPLCYKM